MRTQIAGTQLNENALRWSSATTMSASARACAKRSPIRAISAIVSVIIRRPTAPHARS